jgi:hypothetical protein
MSSALILWMLGLAVLAIAAGIAYQLLGRSADAWRFPPPGQLIDIGGWRKSMSEVAAFVFTALPESYAARTGRPGNVGVIGVAVFREYQPPRPPVSLQQPAPLSRSGARGDEARESAGGNSRDSAAARFR